MGIIERKKAILLNEPHIETASGSIANFSTDLRSRLKKCAVSFLPKQDGTGDPSPSNIRPIKGWNGVNAKQSKNNLFPAGTHTRVQNGITFTYYPNGYIHIEGTSTGYAFLNVPSSMYFTITPGTYTLSYDSTDVDGIVIYLVVSDENGGDIKFLTTAMVPIASKDINFTDSQARLQIGVHPNRTVNIMVCPRLERDSIASAIATYPVKFPATKNLFKSSGTTRTQAGVTWAFNDDGTVTVSGTPTGYSYFRFDYIELPAIGSYCMSGISDAVNVAWDNLLIYDDGMQLIGTIEGGGLLEYKTFDISPYPGAKYIRPAIKRNANNVETSGTIRMMLVQGTIPSAYEPYGTMYGGYVDLVTGEVWKTWESIMLDGVSHYIDKSTGSSAWWHIRPLDYSYPKVESPSSGMLVNTAQCTFAKRIQFGSNYNSRSVFTRKNDWTGIFDTFQEMNDWLTENPQLLVYEMETPELFTTLTPTEIKALIGTNNIWSDANGSVDVDYWTHVDQWPQEGDLIPLAYERYDYLITNGHRARIDTGVPGNDPTLRFHFTFMPIELKSSYNAIFGNYKTENDHYAWRLISLNTTAADFNRGFYVTMGNGSPGGGGTTGLIPVNTDETVLNRKITADISYGEATLSGTRVASSTRPLMEKLENDSNIAIGASSLTTDGYSSVFRIYGPFKIWSHDKLIRNYVPVVRKSDNRAGFYDTVNHTFNPSIWDREFVAGND